MLRCHFWFKSVTSVTLWFDDGSIGLVLFVCGCFWTVVALVYFVVSLLPLPIETKRMGGGSVMARQH